MFLKIELFEYNGVIVMFFELLVLQCIEYFVLMKWQVEQVELDSNWKFIVEDVIRIGVFLVVMFLWYNYLQKMQMLFMNEVVKQIEQEVFIIWFMEVIFYVENVVYWLFGMYEFVVNNVFEQIEDVGFVEFVFVGKCLMVS